MATNLYGYLVTCTSHSVKHRSFFFFHFKEIVKLKWKLMTWARYWKNQLLHSFTYQVLWLIFLFIVADVWKVLLVYIMLSGLSPLYKCIFKNNVWENPLHQASDGHCGYKINNIAQHFSLRYLNDNVFLVFATKSNLVPLTSIWLNP
jgi:hypothetical protein